jgi:hypothetical protein
VGTGINAAINSPDEPDPENLFPAIRIIIDRPINETVKNDSSFSYLTVREGTKYRKIIQTTRKGNMNTMTG